MFLRIKRCFACYFGHVHIKFNYLKILYKTVWALITAVELTMPKVGGGVTRLGHNTKCHILHQY